MTYTIGDRRINLDLEVLNSEEEQLIVSHLKLFKYCLNNAVFKLLTNLKKIIHLYNDIITIYSTLLKKIPNYDDVTLMTSLLKVELNKSEDEFNKIFGNSISERDVSQIYLTNKWQTKAYETVIKPLTVDLLELSQENFDQILRTLYCIEFFFEKFDNLKKLLIPVLLAQTKSIKNCIKKLIYLMNLSTITDNLDSIKYLDPSIVKQLKKIEKITSGIEKESKILDVAFKAFDPSLQQYTNILLGRSILKRDINPEDCQLIRRRNVCYEAAEHVVSIPLSENQLDSSMKLVTKYLIYFVFIFALLLCSIVFRLLKILLA